MSEQHLPSSSATESEAKSLTSTILLTEASFREMADRCLQNIVLRRQPKTAFPFPSLADISENRFPLSRQLTKVGELLNYLNILATHVHSCQGATRCLVLRQYFGLGPAYI